MASRTSAPEATVSEGLDTRSIYYRRATISCSQGASALPFDDASVVHPPSAFGTFRVLHQIGSGVLGPVFRSYDSQRERLAAIKAFKVDLLPEQLPEFAAALRALVNRPVDDAGIARAIDSGVEGVTPFLALEFVSGDPLDAILRESRPVTREHALALCRALGRAIDGAWEIGVGHGALHPRDVFVSDSGEIAVTGFGVAQALIAAGLRAPVRRPYSAPERDGGGPWDRRADVYSLAAIAQELFVRSGAPSADVRAVLERALADDPAARFGTAAEFVEALADAIAFMPQVSTAPAAVTANAHRPMAIDIDHEAAAVAEPDPVGDAPLRPAVEPVVPVTAAATPFEFSDAPSIGVTMAAGPHVIAPRFPWMALVAASLACLAAGGLLGYSVGFTRGADARIVNELASVTAPSPSPARDTPAQPVQSPVTVGAPSIAAAPPSAAPSGSRRNAAVAKPSAGSLEVDSRPRGARVVVDGRAVGQTPLKVSAMSPGDHRVLIELTGHRRVTSTVKVVAGEQTRLAVSLEPTGGDSSGPSSRKRN